MRPLTALYATLGDLVLTSRDEAAGVTWVMGNIDGWSGSPKSTLAPARKARGHGVWAGDAWLDARHLALSGWVEGDTPAAADEAVDRLNAATSLDGVTLAVTGATGVRSLEVRRTDAVLVRRLTDRTLRWSIQLIAPDPRKRGDLLTASTGLPAHVGGLTWPLTWPLSWPAEVITGQVSLTNPGNFAGPVMLRIDGPVAGPIVTHVSSGRSLVFASSLVLGAGEFVTVDMERREVLAQGIEPRNGWITRREWSAFEPGVNTWAFAAVEDDPASLLTVEAVPAWL